MCFLCFLVPGRDREASNLQDALAAPDAGSAGPHRFHDRSRLDRLNESIELGDGPGQLDGIGVFRDVDDAPAKDVRETLHFLAILAGGADLDQHQLALDVRRLRQVHDLHHFDQLVQLLGDLLDDVIRPGGDDGHAGQRRFLGGRHRERYEVVAACGKKTRNPGKRARLVFEHDRNNVSHRSLAEAGSSGAFDTLRRGARGTAGSSSLQLMLIKPDSASGSRLYSSSARIISVSPLPPCTIGYTFSVWSVMKSRNTSSSLRLNASRSADSTSAGSSILMPRCP